MGRFKGRSSIACVRCHGQKLKCNGDNPCQRCRSRGRDCVYPEKKNFVSVPEDYYRWLEDEARRANPAVPKEGSQNSPAISGTSVSNAEDSSHAQHSGRSTPAFEDTSAKGFVQKLRDLSTSSYPGFSEIHTQGQQRDKSSGDDEAYTYSRLKLDFLQPNVTFRLPPQLYALQLLDAFEEAFRDYHWYLRQGFRDRLALTYSDPGSQSGDRNWLCRVSVVLALGETFFCGRTTSGVGARQTMTGEDPSTLPGSDFFEQGLQLLETSKEEPVSEDVEALNLIAFYCYSLNRKKTALSYVSQSIAVVRLLHLDKPKTSRASNLSDTHSIRLLNEHRKRLWWTSYCMDRMVTTELGIPPIQGTAPKTLELPSSAGLTPEELEELFDGSVLAAQAGLCEIKRSISQTVTHDLRLAEGEKTLEVLKPSLAMLQIWRDGLPSTMRIDFDMDIPPSFMEHPRARILASLYLRYHQCFILLLRPLFLQEVASMKQGRYLQPPLPATNTSLREMKTKCLQAAQNNCRLMLALSIYSKIARFGYWDPTHLFSGALILSLSGIAPDLETGALTTPQDPSLYAQCRALLSEMVQLGNPSARDYERLLDEVDSMIKAVPEPTEDPTFTTLEQQQTQPFETTPHMGMDQVLDMGLGDEWYDLDWINWLSTWTQGAGDPVESMSGHTDTASGF